MHKFFLTKYASEIAVQPQKISELHLEIMRTRKFRTQFSTNYATLVFYDIIKDVPRHSRYIVIGSHGKIVLFALDFTDKNICN